MDACTNSIRLFFNEKYGNFTYLCLEKMKINWKIDGDEKLMVLRRPSCSMYIVYLFFGSKCHTVLQVLFCAHETMQKTISIVVVKLKNWSDYRSTWMMKPSTENYLHRLKTGESGQCSFVRLCWRFNNSQFSWLNVFLIGRDEF